MLAIHGLGHRSPSSLVNLIVHFLQPASELHQMVLQMLEIIQGMPVLNFILFLEVLFELFEYLIDCLQDGFPELVEFLVNETTQLSVELFRSFFY
jgi:hypothetical protein